MDQMFGSGFKEKEIQKIYEKNINFETGKRKENIEM